MSHCLGSLGFDGAIVRCGYKIYIIVHWDISIVSSQKDASLVARWEALPLDMARMTCSMNRVRIYQTI